MKMSANLGYMSMLFGKKKEIPDQEKKGFCLQLWERLEI